MSTPLDAAVVVVTFNHATTIAATLRALLALDPPPRELVVIDNASRDATPAIIKQEFPDVRLIETRANLGFAGGCNLGARVTEAASIVLANPDLMPRPDWLRHLIEPLQSLEHTGIVGGKLLYPGSQRLQHAGGLLQLPLGLGQHRGSNQPDHGQYDIIEAVDYVTGAAFATTRALWDKLDGLDERFYPAYYEEVDFCTRARQQGYTVVYTPLAVAEHVESVSLGQTSTRYLHLFHLNRLRYLFKHFNNPWLMRTWLPAELGYVRAVASDNEVAALQAVYLTWQSVFCGYEKQPSISDLDVFPDMTADGGETELQWVERQLRSKATVEPQRLTSRWPLIAKLRNGLLRLASADYIRGLVQAQNDTNQAVLEAIQALQRQRRAADAAVLAQGMLLAKALHDQQE